MAYLRNNNISTWHFSKIVKQANSGELLPLDGNVDIIVEQFQNSHNDETPVHFVGFSGGKGSGKTFLTNLFANYLKEGGKSWLKSLETDEIHGFSFGDGQNEAVKGNHAPDNDSSGIYVWPELFEVNHHNNGKKLVGLFHIHHKCDEDGQVIKPLDILFNMINSRMVDIVWQNKEVTKEVRKTVSQNSLDERFFPHFCSQVMSLHRQSSEAWNAQQFKVAGASGKFIFQESNSPLHDHMSNIRLSKAHQQVLDKVFRNIVDQSFLTPKSLESRDILTVGNFRTYLTEMVNMVNRYGNIIVSNTNFASNPATSGLALPRIPVTKHVAAVDSERLNFALAQFFGSATQNMRRDKLDEWLYSKVYEGSETGNVTLYDVYVADLKLASSQYLEQTGSEDIALPFYESIEQKSTEIVKPNLDILEANINEMQVQLGTNLSDADIKLVVDRYRQKVSHEVQGQLQDTIAYVFAKVERMIIAKGLAPEEKVLQFYDDQIARIVHQKPLIHPVELDQIQCNLAESISAALVNNFYNPAQNLELGGKLKEKRVINHLKNMERLKSFQKKINSLVDKFNGLYQKEMESEIARRQIVDADVLQQLHSEAQEPLLQNFMSEIRTVVRENEPETHMNKLRYQIGESFKKIVANL